MSFVNFTLETGSDGIALVTWDMPGRSMNVIDAAVTGELADIVAQITADPAVKGAVVTSGKESFCAGADLALLQSLGRVFAEAAAAGGAEAANARLFDES